MLPFHENWWAPVQRRSASQRCPPQRQKQLTDQSVKPTLKVGPLWTPISTDLRKRTIAYICILRRGNPTLYRLSTIELHMRDAPLPHPVALMRPRARPLPENDVDQQTPLRPGE